MNLLDINDISAKFCRVLIKRGTSGTIWRYRNKTVRQKYDVTPFGTLIFFKDGFFQARVCND